MCAVITLRFAIGNTVGMMILLPVDDAFDEIQSEGKGQSLARFK
jgi:hypothetical protein